MNINNEIEREKNNNFVFKYIPLSFISNKSEIERQSINTIVFKVVIEEYNKIRVLSDLLINSQYGYTASAKTIGKNRILRITDIKDGYVNWDNVPFCDCDREDTYLLNNKDILIARTGNNISYLVNGKVPKNAVFASYLIRLICDSTELLPEYLYLFLNSYAFWPQILKKQRGATLQNVNAKLMGQLKIPMCPLEVQKEIVNNVNSKITKKIKNENQIIIKILNKCYTLTTEITKQKTLLSKLKQSILQEAIQGKLTADWRKQNPELITGENSAEKLLERIKAEKEKLLKEGKIKKGKTLSPIIKDEIPFELPEGWVWCRLGDAGLFQRGKSKHRPRNDIRLFGNGTIPLVQTGDIAQSKHTQYSIKTINKYYNELGLKQSRLWTKGTLCITIAANIAETGFLCFDACFPDSVVGFSPLCNHVISKFIRYYIDVSKIDIERYAPATAQKNINLGIINELVFSLPPLREQKAIVYKVEALMQKCNKLEQHVIQNKKDAGLLMQAVLKEAFEGKK